MNSMIMALYSSSHPFAFPCVHVFLLLTILCFITSVSSDKTPIIQYSAHCSSDVSESTPTSRVHHPDFLPYISTVRSYFHGGDSLWTRKPHGHSSNGSSHSLTFNPAQKYIYKTEHPEIFKLKAYLTFKDSHFDPLRYSRYGSYGLYYVGNSTQPRGLAFILNGYFSESSGRLCMVGSASWFSRKGRLVNVDAVLRLTFAKKKSGIFKSLVNGSLQSLSSSQDPRYFEPIKIFAFTEVDSYTYSLAASKESGVVVSTPQNKSLSVSPKRFCSVILGNYGTFELENSKDYFPSINCSLRFMSMDVIQCSDGEKKARYVVRFQNITYVDYYQGFDPNTTFVGEGSWDESKNQLHIVACKILNLTKDAHVGDCSLRLSLRYPAVWTIRDNSRIVGEMWTNKTTEDSGFFQMMKFRSTDHDMNGYYSLPGLNYEYTEIERARKICPWMEAKKMEKFPDGVSQDMRFDISVQDAGYAWGNAIPMFVGDELFENYYSVQAIDASESYNVGVEISEADEAIEKADNLNMSYIITFNIFYGFKSNKEFSSLNLSLNSRGEVEIIAEGIYQRKTGHLCMVGCRKLEQNSQDCEILVNFEFPSMNSRDNNLIKGSIKSTRGNSDQFYFPELNITSNAFYTRQARESIWRMDIEIIMVLISSTLACIFIVIQIFHGKSNPEMLPFASLVMLAVLTLGHMIPLVLNFEALFLNSTQQRRMSLGSSGWVEVKEVIVRLVTMVAFLLQARLLQLAWTSRLADGNGLGLWLSERKSAFVTFPLYLAGGFLTVMLNLRSSKNRWPGIISTYDYSPYQDLNKANIINMWGDLRSYAGVILDGFLFPQVLLNIFLNSRERALSRWFYVGTTFVRLLPHAYDLYRAHSYNASMEVEGSYLYANPRADFYSTTWDIIIPCGGMLLAVIIWLQQRFGGRCFLPQRFRDSVVYEKVPNTSSA